MMLMPSIFDNSFFEDWMDFPFTDRAAKHGAHVMKTDVKETDQGYELSIDMPGFAKDDIKAQLNKGYLTISAVKDSQNDQKDEDGKYIRRERYTGSVSRSYYVGEHVRDEDIHAKYQDGILKLEVPREDKQAVEENRFIAIEG